MHRQRIGMVVVAAVLAAGCSEDRGIAGRAGPQPGAPCSEQSWIAGITEICDGVLVYRDYIYDDHGADTSPVYNSPIGDLSPVAGDATYPAGAENTADLVKLAVARSGSELLITAELNTLFSADSTLLAVAIDADDSPETGGGEWTDGTITLGVSSAGWDRIAVFSGGDSASNLITGRMPLPAAARWRLQAVVAQSDGTVMNVAFRGPDEEAKGLTSAGPTAGTFWEDRQAAALADGDISAFGVTVNAADLAPGVTRAAAVGPGLHQRVYVSQYTLPPGEGVSVEGVPGRHGDTGNPCEQYFHFLGKYQPYGIYIPDQPGPHGLQFALHGCAANHASLINNSGMQARFGEEQNRIIVVPLGRGPQGYYSDISERDVLDVLADVLASYPVDRDRIFSGGYSMGGYGALRFAALYPHLFAGAVNWVGFTGDIFNTPLPGNPIPPSTSEGGSRNGAVGNVIDFVGNLIHVPTASLYAGEDELVTAPTGLAMGQRFAELEDVPYVFYFHPVAEHLTFAVLDDWTKEAAYTAERARVANPPRVKYRTDASLAFPEYAVAHDRAYWISGIRGRAEGYIDIDLTSAGCGGATPVFETGESAGPDPMPWVSQFREQVGSEPLARANKLTGTLANVAELTVDAGVACLAAGPVAYDLATDGPVTIRLSDGRRLDLAETGSGSF